MNKANNSTSVFFMRVWNVWSTLLRVLITFHTYVNWTRCLHQLDCVDHVVEDMIWELNKISHINSVKFFTLYVEHV